MSLKKALNTEFQITTTTAYVESESAPDQHRFFFAYKITIKNVGSSTAQLMSRHWIITDALGHIEEVRGPGVVGLQPKITAGQSFEYDSACPLKTSSGSMRGFYHFVDEDGESFEVEIPEFYLIAPTAIH
ncbi:Co2+/Mg2+ efflux protein ApaG [Pseudobdellovibrio exovorus]|nr:Co2+/Mg2+ efflux protein ApaG [Pseudobdellovibrio exovorus]